MAQSLIGSIEDSDKQISQYKEEKLSLEENLQLNVDSQSYGEHSVTDECDSHQK